ncbi:TauD/TfdA family dioxygenase [Coleofasciculus sp. E1-EBD-02]|uniref:TauD/TfdA family dioxygenase n=1 Tax=Coleofasciculus sp. E1-EBD-02 TaxID=3068481 RepID=UPI0032FB0319
MIREVSLGSLAIPKKILRDVNCSSIENWKKISREWKDVADFIQPIKLALKKTGFVVAKDFGIIDFNTQLRSNMFLYFCSMLGKPVEHNIGKKDYVWEIKLRQDINYLPTFSEHKLEAPLHTDTQYRSSPEKYISLFAIKKANCGGGVTKILNFDHVINTLQSSNDGITCLRILEKSFFPFAVPSIFSEYKDKIKIIYAPIISQKINIRYRFDTIEMGLKNSMFSKADNDRKMWALIFLRDHIKNHPCTVSLTLEAGEILIIDNHRVLHGRTSFKDCNRHLLRVRMNDY